ncbi:hypothetical protein FKW50_13085 [Acetobacter pomorum]|uniref:hypothetical protein n=1 Tax=Acetobacter pomorum TaxID=65959 RepID=UPI001280A098|nr:hypothetical protein [Acetobacter pomorum]KAA8420173.1 hypothetical protein FKW54_14285 [Acetobacter pomorum]KAA8431452.1 hypothetical protein FKW50_13085 [Acetobacter pomorum]KAA8447016.1 hypothetical protein FKW52_14505 [Acetobacter pomorum]
MPNYLVSYLLKETNPDIHPDFKEKAMDEGFSDRMLILTKKGDWKFFVLPHTTIWGTFDTRDDAKEALSRVEASIPKADIERYILVQQGDGYIRSNRTFPGTRKINEITQCIAHQRGNP